jgi:alpha-N-arabinofuranosidase
VRRGRVFRAKGSSKHQALCFAWRDGIIAAVNINMFARHADRVRAANIAQMINVLQSMILTDGPRMTLTPTYHVFRMYIPFQDATFVPVRFNAGTHRNGDIRLPRVDAIAARDQDGALWLALTNIDPNQEARIDLGAAFTSATGEVLTAPAVNTINTFDAPDAVSPAPYAAEAVGGRLELVLPSKSVMVVRVS